jgi:hypothetical protein
VNNIDEFFHRCNLLMEGQAPIDIIRRTLEILREPEQWTATARARDEYGNHVAPYDPRAVCWCIEGAVSMACNRFGIMPPYLMLILDEVASTQYGCPTVTLFEMGLQDNHWRVVKFLEQVIERLQAPVP